MRGDAARNDRYSKSTQEAHESLIDIFWIDTVTRDDAAVPGEKCEHDRQA
jgi:hypothetical protein